MSRLRERNYKELKALNLYRYDLVCPPAAWSEKFKSPEYVYDEESDALKIKNQIGAFFFFDSKDAAYATGCVAAKEKKKNEIWLTSTTFIQTISLLDFSHIDNISSILLAFNEFGIDVLNDRFYKFSSYSACTSFKGLRSLFDQLNALQEKEPKDDKTCVKICNLCSSIGDFFFGNEKVNYFGQLLTDFSNGEEFKRMLKEKGYNGYIFKENNESRTFCIFDSTVLADPVHERVGIK